MKELIQNHSTKKYNSWNSSLSVLTQETQFLNSVLFCCLILPVFRV